MRRISPLVAGVVFAATIAATPPAAEAAVATTTFQVSLTVLSECIVAATPMAFGSVSLIGNAANATSLVTVTCTPGTVFSIGLNNGATTGATIAARLLRGPGVAGTSTVPYTLFQDAARTILWGDTVDTDVDAGTATGLPQVFNVYGRILGGQAAAPGAYTDIITVSVTY